MRRLLDTFSKYDEETKLEYISFKFSMNSLSLILQLPINFRYFSLSFLFIKKLFLIQSLIYSFLFLGIVGLFSFFQIIELYFHNNL